MKIHFKMDGGFAYLPALSKPFVVETANLDNDAANQLETFVRQSGFFNLPARRDTAPKGAADYTTYTITVEDEHHNHTIRLNDPVTDSNLQRLVSQLRIMAQQSKS